MFLEGLLVGDFAILTDSWWKYDFFHFFCVISCLLGWPFFILSLIITKPPDFMSFLGSGSVFWGSQDVQDLSLRGLQLLFSVWWGDFLFSRGRNIFILFHGWQHFIFYRAQILFFSVLDLRVFINFKMFQNVHKYFSKGRFYFVNGCLKSVK